MRFMVRYALLAAGTAALAPQAARAEWPPDSLVNLKELGGPRADATWRARRFVLAHGSRLLCA